MPFLDVTRPKKDAPKWLHELYKTLKKDVNLCEAFNAGCASCRAWAAYDVLREFYE